MIALISKHTRNADGAKWEMQCANKEGIPMIGIHIHKNNNGHFLEQYKLYVEMADRISNRRQTANSFFCQLIQR